MGFDEDDEHAEDDVCDDHWGVAVAVSMSEVAPEEEASKANVYRRLHVQEVISTLSCHGLGKLWQTKHACASLFCVRLASEFAILPCLLIFETSQI